MKFDTEKLSGIFAYLSIIGAVFASIATMAGTISPKYGAICLAISTTISSFTKRVHRVGRKKKMPKTFVSSFLIICLGLMLTACPKKSDLKTAYNASKSIAQYTETAAATIGDLYTTNIISYDAKEKLIAKLKIVRNNGKRFQAEIDALFAVYKSNLPTDKLNALDIFFNTEVIAPFVDLLNDAGILSAEASQKVLTAIVFLKSAILTISQIFGNLRGSASYKFYESEVIENA